MSYKGLKEIFMKGGDFQVKGTCEGYHAILYGEVGGEESGESEKAKDAFLERIPFLVNFLCNRFFKVPIYEALNEMMVMNW